MKQQKKKNRKKKGSRGNVTLNTTTSACSRDDTTMPEEMKSLGATIFSDESVIHNAIKPSEFLQLYCQIVCHHT